MVRIFRTLLLLPLLLAACSPAEPSPQAPSPTLATSLPSNGSVTEIPPALTLEVPPSTRLVATLSTPHIDQAPDGVITPESSYPQDCGYQWANQDLPELSSRFLRSIQALQPGAQAGAFAFGENCMYADGSVDFLPMETDFNITLPVSSLTEEAALGEWIVKVMQVIDALPPEQISGPRPGRVSITFEANGERGGVTFYIDQYRALQSGLRPAEIYQALKNSP